VQGTSSLEATNLDVIDRERSEKLSPFYSNQVNTLENNQSVSPIKIVKQDTLQSKRSEKTGSKAKNSHADKKSIKSDPQQSRDQSRTRNQKINQVYVRNKLLAKSFEGVHTDPDFKAQ
jgi:hypothetical protein